MGFVTIGPENNLDRASGISDDVKFATEMPELVLLGLVAGGLWLWMKSSKRPKPVKIGPAPIQISGPSGSGRYGRGG
jgi:hypothetical protein